MSLRYPNNLPEWLKLKMEDHNLGMRELARRVGVSHPTISDALNGKAPSLDTAIALAKVFDETPEFILRTAGILAPIGSIDEFREILLRETANLTREEQLEVLAYISMKKRLKQENGAKPAKGRK
jgi:transcriptional regulator with XRE-family HTH domain